jgi:hypothetical protein
MTAAGLIAGNAEGVTVWVSSPPQLAGSPGPAAAMFPMRPGDRRIIQFFGADMENGQHIPYVARGPVVQAYWLEGATSPVVIVR